MSLLTSSGRFSARETVIGATPATHATSISVTLSPLLEPLTGIAEIFSFFLAIVWCVFVGFKALEYASDFIKKPHGISVNYDDCAIVL